MSAKTCDVIFSTKMVTNLLQTSLIDIALLLYYISWSFFIHAYFKKIISHHRIWLRHDVCSIFFQFKAPKQSKGQCHPNQVQMESFHKGLEQYSKPYDLFLPIQHPNQPYEDNKEIFIQQLNISRSRTIGFDQIVLHMPCVIKVVNM